MSRWVQSSKNPCLIFKIQIKKFNKWLIFEILLKIFELQLIHLSDK